MAGYIKLFRGWRDTDGLTQSVVFSDCEAWLWLLENAAWKPRTRFNAKGEEIHVERGQLHVSLASLSSAWGWSKKRVRTFLDRLERVSKVGTAKAQSGTILTICKYDEYQSDQNDEGTAKGTAGAQPGHTHKEGKEGKEKKKDNITHLGSSVARPNDVGEQVWADFVALRRAKRAPLTPTALAGIRREVDKAGWELEDALSECVARGWQGFKADWIVEGRADPMANFIA